MAITAHISDTSRAEGLELGFGSLFRLFALLTAYISLVVPTAAWGDVYKWTDAKGITVFSDVLPRAGEKVKDFEVVAKAARPETKVPAQAATPTEQALLGRIDALNRQLQAPTGVAQAPKVPPQAVTPAEQALLARVEMLERQLQAQQYAAPQPPVAPPPTYSSYYPPAPQPPPPATGYYDSGYDSGYYDSGYYPSYSPSYSYPVVASYAYAYPARTYVSRPVSVASHGGSFHGSGGHSGGGGRGGRR